MKEPTSLPLGLPLPPSTHPSPCPAPQAYLNLDLPPLALDSQQSLDQQLSCLHTRMALHLNAFAPA